MPSKDAITYRKIHNTGVISARESKHGIESHSDDNLAPVRTLRKRGCPRVQPPKYLNAVHSNDTDNLSHIDMQPITSDTTCADCQAMYGNNEDRSRVPGGEGVKAGDTADIYSCQRCVSGADGQSGVLAAKEPDYEQCDISGDRGCLTWTSGRVDGQLFVQRQTSDTDDAKDVVSGSENTCVDSAGSRDTDDNAVSVNDDHDNAVSVNGDHDNAVSVNGDHDNAVSVDGDHANAVSVNGGGNNSIVSGGGDQDCAVSQGFDNGIIVSGGGDKNQSETDVKLVSETTNGSFLDLSFIDDTGHRPTDTRIAVVVCEMRETTLDPTREAVDGNVHLDGGTETSTDPGHDDTNVTLDDDRFKHDTLMLELLSLVPRDDSYDDSRDDSQSSDDPGWRRPQQLRRRTRAPVRDCGDSDSDDSFLRSYSSHLFQMDDDDDDDDDDVGYRTFGMLHEMADYDDEDDNETSLLSSPEPELLSPFIVGELRHTECCVCLETRSLHVRACCAYAACDDCLARYYTAQVRAACIRVRCIGCDAHVPRDEIIFRLDDDAKRLFDRFLVDANRHPRIKTCPRCSVTTRLDAHAQLGQPEGLRITCTDCLLDWCFPCQAPWHDGATCRQYRKGDKLLKAWARQQQRGQANAQKCPRCKTYIQRATGCDHMTCTQCSMDFCYACGGRYYRLKYLGSHHSRLSVLGCRKNFKPNKPVQRRLIRGTLFGIKVVSLPILATLAVGAGVVVAGAGVVALPVYGSYKLHKYLQRKKALKGKRDRRREVWRAREVDDVADFMNGLINAATIAERPPPRFEIGDVISRRRRVR